MWSGSRLIPAFYIFISFFVSSRVSVLDFQVVGASWASWTTRNFSVALRKISRGFSLICFFHDSWCTGAMLWAMLKQNTELRASNAGFCFWPQTYPQVVLSTTGQMDKQTMIPCNKHKREITSICVCVRDGGGDSWVECQRMNNWGSIELSSTQREQ